jgi:hypothetical protein
MKRILAAVFSFAISITFPIPSASALADGTVNCGGGGSFTISSNAVTGNTSCSGAVAIPEGVTSVAGNAFKNVTAITTLSIPSTVTSIGGSAFEGATSLSNVSFSEGVTTIGNFAFNRTTSLSSINLPNSVTSIGNSSFSGSGATSIVIGNGLTTIGSNAFRENISLTSITLGSGLTTIGTSAFFGATAISSFNFLGSQPSVQLAAFFLVPTSAKVYVTSENASSFGGIGATWNGFLVELVPVSAPPSSSYDDGAAVRAREEARQAAELRALLDISTMLSISAEPTFKQFEAAGLDGITEKNLPIVVKELHRLSKQTQIDTAVLRRISQKYSYLDEIAKGGQFKSINPMRLVEARIIPAENRTLTTMELRNLDESQRDSYEEIEAAVRVKTAELQARKVRLVKTLAR